MGPALLVSIKTQKHNWFITLGVGNKFVDAVGRESDVDFDDDDVSNVDDAYADADVPKDVVVKEKRFKFEVGEWVDFELLTSIERGHPFLSQPRLVRCRDRVPG